MVLCSFTKGVRIAEPWTFLILVEKGVFIDCLIDTNDHNCENYIVLLEKGGLKLYSSIQLKEFIPAHPFQLIGKAIKWGCPF